MEIRGWFYFRLTGSGNLIGEFGNNRTIFNFSQAADRDLIDINFTNNFIGIYNNYWNEGNDRIQMQLVITAINGQRNRFNLVWTLNSEPAYIGLGTIVDGILIGNYESVQ